MGNFCQSKVSGPDSKYSGKYRGVVFKHKIRKKNHYMQGLKNGRLPMMNSNSDLMDLR